MRKDLDQIHVSATEIEKILEWRNENAESVKRYPNVFSEAVICSQDGLAKIHFTVVGDETEYRYYFAVGPDKSDVMVAHALTRRRDDGLFIILKSGTEEDYSTSTKKVQDFLSTHNETVADFVRDNTTIHSSLMAYIAFRSSEIEIVEEQCIPDSRLKKAERHNKYNADRQIKIKKQIVRLKNPSYRNITKKEYTRIMKSWGVRGHYRHYKSGNISWVKPYTKGEGAKTSKKYVVGEDL